MGLRFQRRIRIAPGVHLNLSKSGLGLSVGPRGASVSFGPRGTWTNVGIPGTGLSYRSHVGSHPAARRRAPARRDAMVKVGFNLDTDTGALHLEDAATGEPLGADLDQQVRRQHRDQLVDALTSHAEAENRAAAALEQLHLDIPAPDAPLTFEPVAFPEPEPVAPVGVPYGLGGLGWLWPPRRRHRIETQAAVTAGFEEAHAAWAKREVAHDGEMARLRDLFDRRASLSGADAEALLGFHLARLHWPRETRVSFEVRGDEVVLDVDLPELEDLPATEARVTKRPLGIAHDPLSARRLRERYMHHVHGVALRLVGETFAWLPACARVTLSAYTQRPDRATARVEDTWLFSVRVDRAAWGRLDFAHLGRLDPVACLAGFELRRDMTSTGIFKAVTPFALPEGDRGRRGRRGRRRRGPGSDGDADLRRHRRRPALPGHPGPPQAVGGSAADPSRHPGRRPRRRHGAGAVPRRARGLLAGATDSGLARVGHGAHGAGARGARRRELGGHGAQGASSSRRNAHAPRA